MRKSLLLSLLLLLALPGCGQGLHFKFGGGLSTHYGRAKCVGAFKAGIGYGLEIDQHWVFTPTLEIYGKGWKDPNETVFVFDRDGKQVMNDDGTPRTGVKNRSATQNYLQLPLLFSYYLRTGQSRYVVFSLGPYLAYGITGKQKTKGDTGKTGAETLYYEEKTFNEPGTHRFDCGLQALAGYQFPSGVIVGVEADFGLAKFNDRGDRNLSALLSVGYRLR